MTTGLPPDELRRMSWRLSRRVIEMTTRAGSGHPSSSLSCIDLLTVLYFGGVMRYEPDTPGLADRDRLILSKGHAAPALYAVLAEAGYFDCGLLATLRELGSPLEGHPNMRVLPGVEASTGSLGQGLSIGLGHALAGRLDKLDFHVFVIIGDGESDEGQVWEAAMAAAKYGVGHLTAILDFNGFQQTGPVRTVMPSLEPLKEKWTSFGWDVRETDGHDLEDIRRTLKRVTCDPGGEGSRPHIVIAHTLKGKGLSPFENDHVNRKHGIPLSREEAGIALKELDTMYGIRDSGAER